jgi:hypothetical protein
MEAASSSEMGSHDVTLQNTAVLMYTYYFTCISVNSVIRLIEIYISALWILTIGLCAFHVSNIYLFLQYGPPVRKLMKFNLRFMNRTAYIGPKRTNLILDPLILAQVLLPNGKMDSSVGIAPGYGLDDRGVGVRVPVRLRIFSSPRRPDRLWVHLTSYPMGTRGSFLGGKAGGA